VEALLRASVGGAPSLRLTERDYPAPEARWPRIAEVTELSENEREQLPGVHAPDWAAAGDAQSNDGFTFVCQARATDERTAEAAAKARCNEKLCRLFGVQISARTTVTENLNELKAESEVSEQCADVRAVGRKTTNKSSECTADGCVYWVKQAMARPMTQRSSVTAPTIIVRKWWSRRRSLPRSGRLRAEPPAVRAVEGRAPAYGRA
jgi:hypothetical protein